jgi:nucleotide-binding universal stress UspA family protein
VENLNEAKYRSILVPLDGSDFAEHALPTAVSLARVSDKLVRQAGMPILFLRPQAAFPDLAQEPGIRRVLIPLDGSALAESILQPVLALLDGAQTEYTLLQIIGPVAELSYGPIGGNFTGFPQALQQLQQLEQQESRSAHDYLERLAERLRASSFAIKTRVALNERPATAILDHASAHPTDLIALATHGRGGLKRLVLGSVGDKVLRGAATPVFVYRPTDIAASAL